MIIGWQQEQQELREFHEKLRGRAVALEEELGRVLNSLDEISALVMARRALEVIVIELCERELKRERGTEPLDGLFGRFGDLVPERVLTAMRNLNRLGNMGAHPKPVTSQEVRQAFIALAVVLHWYVVEYKRLAESPATAPDAASAPVGGNPYRGLDAFEEKDADRFFGRERYLENTLLPAFDALAGAPSRLLALVGPSGSGKSSLARAGLLPALKRKFPACRLLVATPTARPLEALARVLARLAKPDDPNPAGKTQEFLDLLLREDRQGLRRIADGFAAGESAPLVLLLDQFEEVFTLCQDREECRRYLDNLLHGIGDPACHLYLLLTLRSDFLADSQGHPAFNQVVSRQAHLVPVLDDDGLSRAITEPARRAGHELEEGVVQLLIEQSAGREGALPLLQYALTEIWRGLQQGREAADSLRAIGGVGGALAGRAQAIYGQLGEAEQRIARRAFLKLVQLGEGGPDTRRRVALDDLVAGGEDRERVRDILHRFAGFDARFLTFGQEQGRDCVAITHDALIQHWRELREWLNANRDDLRLLNRLDAAAKHWDAAKRARGLLWRRPDLDWLRKLAGRRGEEFTRVQAAFHRASVAEERRAVWLKRGAVALLVVLTLAAGTMWREVESQRSIAILQELKATLGEVDAFIAFNKLRQAADFFTQISKNKLTNAPNMDDTRRELLEKALELYQELANRQPGAPGMREELALANFGVGNIKQDLGDKAGAGEAYRHSIEIFGSLAREHPETQEYHSNLAVSHNNLGILQKNSGDAAGARESYRKALEIRERLAREHPEVPEYQNDLAKSHSNLGNLQADGGDAAGARESYRKASDLFERLAQAYPDIPEYRTNADKARNNLAELERPAPPAKATGTRRR